MTAPAPSVIGAFADLATLVIVGVSLYRFSRQAIPRFRDVKIILLVVHAFFLGIFVLDLGRNFTTSAGFMEIYTGVGGTLILLNAILLSSVAYVVHVRPEEPTFWWRLRSLLRNRLWPHGIVIFLFAAYIFCVICYLVLAKPYTVRQVVSIAGGSSEVPVFNGTFLVLALFTLALFIAYPSQELLQARRKAVDPEVRRAMLIMTLGWTAIGNGFFIFNGLLVILGFDGIPFGYLLVALAFAFTATVFRRPTTLSGFFVPVAPVAAPEYPFTSRLGSSGPVAQGTSMLLEFDPSSNYELIVKNFAVEELSKSHPVFVFTSKNSPVQRALSDLAGVRFLSFSRQVSSLRQGTDSRELLIPDNNQSVILSALGKTIDVEPSGSAALVFDNLTNQIVNSGTPNSYKFVKQANEVLFEAGVTSLFLIISRGQEETAIRLIESLFRKVLEFDNTGLKIKK